MKAFDASPQRNFNISKFCYKISLYSFLWIVVVSQLDKVLEINGVIAAFAVVLPFFAIFILIPCGLFFVIKSFVVKEPFHRYRILYLIGHLFFLLIMIGFVVAIVSDISKYYIMGGA